MSAAAAVGLTLLAPAAGSGKTGIAMGIARSLADAGVKVEPFKAVSVVGPGDPAFRSAPPWQHGVLHNCGAAQRPQLPWHNPVTVIRPDRTARSGELYLWGEAAGEIAVPGDDLLDLAVLSATLRRRCRDAVAEAVNVAAAADGFVVVEGGGAAGEIAPDNDLANHVAPLMLGFPVLLVLNAGRSGHGAALLGLARLLHPELYAMVVGFVANQVRDEAHRHSLGERLTGRSPFPLLAMIDEVHQPPDYDGSREACEHIYSRRARQIRESGLLKTVYPPAGDVESARTMKVTS